MAPGGWAVGRVGEPQGGWTGAGRAGSAPRALTKLQAEPYCVWEGDLSHSGDLAGPLLQADAAVVGSGATEPSSLSQTGAGGFWGAAGCAVSQQLLVIFLLL